MIDVETPLEEKEREERVKEEGEEDKSKYIPPPFPFLEHSHDVKEHDEILILFPFFPLCLIPPPSVEEEEEMFSKRVLLMVEEGKEEEEKK
jgi:hypothetical protein